MNKKRTWTFTTDEKDLADKIRVMVELHDLQKRIYDSMSKIAAHKPFKAQVLKRRGK